jgi:hypothetical protein
MPLQVWKEEHATRLRQGWAALVIQREWRCFRHFLRYNSYKTGKVRRKETLARLVLSLWQRVTVQRPGVRQILWDVYVAWRVVVCEKRIALEKAEDLLAVWNALHAKRMICAWAGVYQIQRHARTTRVWKCFGPWLHLWGLQKRCKKMRNV